MMVIDLTKCINCRVCETVCFQQAISIDKGEINQNCIECFHCAAACPVGCIQNDQPADILLPHKIEAKELKLMLLNRRSHRIFEDKPVSAETLQNILDVVRYSPTSKNSQQVHITVVASPSKIQNLNNKIQQSLNKSIKNSINIFTAPILWLKFGGKQTRSMFRFKQRFFERQKHVKNMITYNAPTVLLFHTPNTPLGNPEMDCNIWASYATLYAESLGLKTCFAGYVVKGFQCNKNECAELGIPKNHKVFSAFLMGYPKITFKRKANREKIKATILS